MLKQIRFIIYMVVCFGLISQLYADNTIIVNQKILQQAQSEIIQQGNSAIEQIPQTTKQLSNINLNNLDLRDTNEQVKQSDQYFKNIHPLSNQLPNGDKYYLFSESLVNENQQFLAQYNEKSPLNVNQTISDYNAMIKNAKSKLGTNRLLIFISSSIPKKTIIHLMQQGSVLGAIFVIRGLINNSYVKTYKYFYQLKGQNTVGVMINPTLFKVFDINSVPTFALYQSSEDLMQTACNIVPNYTKVTGEVSIEYALTQLKQSENLELAQIASNELDVLQNSNYYKGN
jgi:conjugal transfer pilus assembly protein TrbC